MKSKVILATTILLVLISCTTFGQPAGGGPPGSGGPPCWPPPCVPIDGGIGILIAIASIIGVKKLYSKKDNLGI